MATADKKAAQSARVLKIYCELLKKHGCEGCIFKPCYEYFSNVPASWTIPMLPRWTKTDKALAEALKLAGVKTIFRKEGKLWLANDFYSMVDHCGILDAFQELQSGERISLDDIISSKGERADE